MSETLTRQIKSACGSTQPFTKQRNKALASVKWRLRCGLLYAGLDGLEVVLVEQDNAQVFDGRDNEAMKKRFYEAASGYKFEVELCAS